MALFVARPSRGSWVFFGLVALGVLAARTYGNYERSVVRRDAPLSQLTQDLAVCTFGSDSPWLLAGSSAAGWQDAISAWMRKAVSTPQDPRWPERCVPIADRLVERLGRTPSTNEATLASARAVQRSLREGARDPFELVAQADSEVFARQVADLFEKVRTLSQGAREGWRSVPSQPDRFGTLHTAKALPLRPLHASLTRPTLVSGSSFAAYALGDGALHLYDVSRGTMRDITVGAGAPVGAARDGALRVERDDGAAWMLPAQSPRIALAPSDFSIEGAPSRFAWEVSSTPLATGLLTLDHGSLRLRVLRAPATAWTDALPVGPDESAVAAVLAPDGDAWRVSVLRPTVSSGVLTQYVVREVAPVAPASHGHAPAVVAPDAPVTLNAESNFELEGDVGLFGARVLTCAAGASRYFALVGEGGLTVYRVVGDRVQSSRAAAFWPRERDVTLSCDADRALVMTSPMLPRAGGFVFSFQRGAGDTGVVVEPPTVGPAASVRAVVLVRDGLAAIVSNTGALRAFRQASRPGQRGVGSWEPAGLVALGSSPQWTRAFTRIEAMSTGDHIALLVTGSTTLRPPRVPEGQEAPAQPAPEPSPVPFVSVAGSLDGGATFWSL